MKKFLLLFFLQAVFSLTFSQTITIYNPYETVDFQTANHYKANLHTHTTESDGSSIPAVVINQYHAVGEYDILAITDHSHNTWAWSDYIAESPAAPSSTSELYYSASMLAISGNEMSSVDHTGSLFNDYNGDGVPLDQSLEYIRSQGGLAIFYHPGRYGHPASWYTPYFDNYGDVVMGLEVYNQGDRYPNDRLLWDDVNQLRDPDDLVWGFSDDDMHTISSHAFRNYQHLLMNNLTEAETKDAIRNGAFYFSYEPGGNNSSSLTYGQADTPVLTNVVISGSTITISGTNYTSIAWYDENTSVVGTSATIDVSSINSNFVRAVLTNSDGVTYTQPFGIGTSTVQENQFCESFDTFTTGNVVGSDGEWFDNGSGPIVEATNGVDGSQGLAPGSSIFTWTNYPFDWTAADFTGFKVQLDFQASASGEFDDDRVGWMIDNTTTDSDFIFGVQVDNASGHLRMEGYWDNTFGDDAGRVEMADLDVVTIANNGWYRLIADITKLGATSASIDGELWSLDASGNPVSLVASGTIPNTASVGSGITPNVAYFTGPIWPAYKNHTGAVGAADNACFEVFSNLPTITITGTPLAPFTSTPGNPSLEQSYTVAGSDLTGNITITAPSDFEVSTTSGSGFGSSVVLTETGGSVSSTPIYTRFTRATEGISSGNITHSSTGVTTQNVAVSGTASLPSVASNCEDFNAFTIGNEVGDDADWYDNNDGPVVEATSGVAGSQGLAAGNAIFTWTANTFDWNAADFEAVSMQMDFKTDGSAHFDDDRIGWMIGNPTVSSSNIMSVQLDPGGSGYNIEGYWDGATADRRPSIVDLTSLTANTWYRFWVKFTKLTATSCGIDVSLTELDGSGNPTGTPVTGSIANTAALGADAPNAKYFTSGLSPAYKNYTAAAAPADNACFEVFSTSSGGAISITGTPLSPFTSTPGTPSVEQSYTVAGSNLTGDITINAPTDFEIATTLGTENIEAVNLVSNGDFEVGNTTSWNTSNSFGGAVFSFNVNSTNPINGNYDAILALTTAGTSNSRPLLECYMEEAMVIGSAYTFKFKTKVISGSPRISFINYGNGLDALGALSGEQNWEFSVESALTGNNFVLFYVDGTSVGSFAIDDVVFESTSSTGGGFGPQVILAQSGGSVSPTTIYARLNRATAGATSGNITHSCPGTITQNVAVSGTAGEPSVSSNCEDFEAFTNGNTVGSDSDWFDGGSGPVIGASNGVAGSQGLAAASAIFTWTANPFDWNATDFIGFKVQMDFQASGSGEFDDDRVGWMIDNTTTNSDFIFGIQLDNAGSHLRMESYWDNTFGDNAGRVEMADLDAVTISANGWYRLIADITKLSATSASIDGELWSLDGSGNPVSMVASGTISNTGSVGSGITPNVGYFTGPIWPAYKNYTGVAGSADNACFEVISSVSTPVITISGDSFDNYPFSAPLGSISSELSYSVEGSGLTDDITITAPADFEVSTTSGSGFGSSLVLTESSGSVSQTTIYVRLNRSTIGTSTGDIAHTSTNAATENVSVKGTVYEGQENWVAYNDCVYDPSLDGTGTDPNGQSVHYLGTNVTTYGIGNTFTGSSSGALTNQLTGGPLSASVTFTESGGVVWQPDVSSNWYGGYDCATGTDARNTFGGKADMTGVIYYGSSGWYVDVTFTGLDPSLWYTFATSASRANASYGDRNTRYTLLGVDAAINVSSTGVYEINNESVWFNTGDNHDEGYVARWTDIQPGADGSFTVRAEENGDNAEGKAYAFDVFMLKEVNDPLPVELTSFSGSVSENIVTLNWQTETEINNYGFEIERRAEESEWQKMGFVEGHGNSNSPKHYSYVDGGFLSGKYQYRLKQIDNNGIFEYSNIIEVDLTPSEFTLYQNYPNPFNPSTTIKYALPEAGEVKLVLFNMLGEEVAVLVNELKEAGVHDVDFNASDLGSGIYFYKLESSSFVSVKKMMLVK
jgi:type IX secretion system substrate protein